MTIGAEAGALVSSLVASGPGTAALAPNYGVAFRFSVRINGIDLGAWQSCSGLKVEFKAEARPSGGDYSGDAWLPTGLSWSRIVLKRAVEPADSQKVQSWLKNHGHDWIAGAPVEGDNSTITLFDSEFKPVMHWLVRGVRPASWSGPDLDAQSSKVAIETLELVHRGFTVGIGAAPSRTGTESQDPRNATFTLEGPEDPRNPGGTQVKVEFEFGPEEIGYRVASRPSKTGQTLSGSGPQGSESYTVEAGRRQYSVEKLVIRSGPSGTAEAGAGGRGASTVASEVAKLQKWALEAKPDQSAIKSLPKLTLRWGGGFNGITVQLTRLSVSFTRFEGGVVTRAKVGFDLEEVDPGEPPRSSPPPPPPPPPLPTPPPRQPTKQERALRKQKVKLQPVSARTGSGPRTPTRAGAMNPTSRAVAGRSSVLMRAADTLPLVALSCYGDAQLWRALAEANGIDDPLRVRPGTELLVPAKDEVSR